MGLAVALLALLGLQVLGAQPALADGEGNADVVNNVGCMQDEAGFNLNCTANDVQLSEATDIVILDDGCAFPGDTVDFTATFTVVLTAQARHDIGIWFAEDGGDAITGTCTAATPAYDDDNNPLTPSADWLDLDGTTDPLPGEHKPNPDGLQDTCGDINSDHNPLFPSVTLTATCIDDNGDGKLDLPNCTSWRQSGANDLCTDPTQAFPGAPSKCRCSTLTVDIDVPAGSITVVKGNVDGDELFASVNEPGGEVTFPVSVTNDSLDPATIVTIDTLSDDIYGDITQVQGDITATTCSVPQPIAGGATYNCTFTVNVTGNAGDTETDTVTASGVDDRDPPNVVMDSDEATVMILDVPPEASLTKTVTQMVVTYKVVITNESVSSDPLTVDSLTDDEFGDITQIQGDVLATTCATGAEIQTGDMYMCTFDGLVTTSPHTNTVTGTVSDDDGTHSIDRSDSATVTFE